MIVYNITNKVQHNIEAEWLRWQQEEHIPDIMQSGQFEDYRILRLLDHDDEEGVTYIVQYTAKSMKEYERYINEYAPPLREKAMKKWSNQFIAFRTVMEVVN